MNKKKNDIFKRQNEQRMQRLVVAQHFAYSSAKKLAFVLFVILVIVPLSINIALFFDLSDEITGILSLISLSVLFIGEILRDVIANRKIIAAKIQQVFDIYVFGLDYDFLIDENELEESIQKFTKKDWHRKKDWYSNYEEVDKNKTIFYCQKENIDWTGNLSRRYKNFLIGVIITLLLVFVLNGILNNSSIIKLLSIAVTVMPIISYGVSGLKKIKQDDEKRKDIDKFANFINDNLDKLSDSELGDKVICLQIMIYESRKTKYLIPDWFEKIYYKSMQKLENAKTTQRISNYKKKNKRDL